MKPILMLLCITGTLITNAQYTVVFKLRELPASQQATAPIYVAGNFNDWKPDSVGFSTTGRELKIQLPKGRYEYKFTRSSWATAETDSNGMALNNRRLQVESDTTIWVDIAGWADHFTAAQKQSTASKNVHIIDTAFFIPQLARYRRIWIYLPPSYVTSHRKYPVLYMHDGQNVFDEKTAFAGEWGVDETLDTLSAHTTESIVVAIDHAGEKRINEYAPFDMEKYGKGEGAQYADFLVHTLKPYIEKRYRVKKARRYQALAGSSMGGLISFYTMLQHPKAFGAAGVFSPSFWIAPELKNFIAEKGKRVRGRIYFYAGKEESESMVPDMMAVFGQLSAVSKAKLTTVIRTRGEHSEARWRIEFPLFYHWLVRR